MKNQKLKLEELKVQSFVTDFDKAQDQTQEVNGGYMQVSIFTTSTIDIWSLACSYGCTFKDKISDIINPVERYS